MRFALLLIVLFALTACRPATPATPPAAPVPPPVTLSPSEAQHVWQDAKQTFDHRCVVCHGCYDSPCQLVLSSFEGIERGASKQEVYEGSRLLAIDPTRLHIDAHGTEAWREKGFWSVLGERDPSRALIARMLQLKRDHPLPRGGILPEGFDLGLDRTQQCPKPEEFDGFAKDHPSWGMPYALPGLSDAEHEALTGWLADGAPHAPEPPLAPALLESIARWEAFLNTPDDRVRLSARYIYEHLFLGSLYFDGIDDQTFFRLVRSRTPSGQPVDEIATRRPFEDPGVQGLYYRFVRRERTKLAKTLMPYPLSDARLARFKKLFVEADYKVAVLPGYDRQTAANPFATFASLPVASRYRFLLEEANFTMSGFIKGPVCRGQVALDVINDRFWIAFVHPDSPVVKEEAQLLAGAMPDLALPAEQGSNGILINWRKYERRQRRYLDLKSKFLSQLARSPDLVTLEQIWDGDGENNNAALTVMRHYDSATVVKGWVGGDPKTTWVVGYALFERIHYLLVAGFDVFGNIGHQLHSRLYMDFLRMEAESNFISFLPKARRRALVEAWYRDTSNEVKDHVYGKLARFDQETGLKFSTDKPEVELLRQMHVRLEKVLEKKYALGEEPEVKLRDALKGLALLSGHAASRMPETSFLEVRREHGTPRFFTLLRDSAHTNVAHLFREDKRRKPDEDQLTLLRGFVGAYPNALFSVDESELGEFTARVESLNSNEAYDTMRDRFGVRRTDPRFWELSDRMHEAYRDMEPLESGLLDFNRLEGN
ncbi:MAG: fatty acid cis/trans isomerase [Polyangiales bacterium]